MVRLKSALRCVCRWEQLCVFPITVFCGTRGMWVQELFCSQPDTTKCPHADAAKSPLLRRVELCTIPGNFFVLNFHWNASMLRCQADCELPATMWMHPIGLLFSPHTKCLWKLGNAIILRQYELQVTLAMECNSPFLGISHLKSSSYLQGHIHTSTPPPKDNRHEHDP